MSSPFVVSVFLFFHGGLGIFFHGGLGVLHFAFGSSGVHPGGGYPGGLGFGFGGGGVSGALSVPFELGVHPGGGCAGGLGFGGVLVGRGGGVG